MILEEELKNDRYKPFEKDGINYLYKPTTSIGVNFMVEVVDENNVRAPQIYRPIRIIMKLQKNYIVEIDEKLLLNSVENINEYYKKACEESHKY